jgi:glycosyltransferase involved in cell wall biosynthesis
VTNPLRIVQLNLAYSPALDTPSALLDSYHTLTGWADAVERAGADVVTVQRYAGDADVTRGRCRVLFVRDEGGPVATPSACCHRPIDAVIAFEPDVVHVNGLMFPGVIGTLRQRLPSAAAIAVQDHSGTVPRTWPWPFDWLRRRRWQEAFERADAFVFTARELAEPWHAVGLAREATILEVPEAGTTVTPLPREDAMALTGLCASPAILWVGRLDHNKDPLTALSALEMALPRLPDARVWMIYGDAPLEAVVAERIATSTTLRERVTLVGAVPHEQIASWFSAADIFVGGSHHEGSGYSLIEAMACGVMPCVTSIPAFRSLTGGRGALWTVGDADACAAALLDLAARDREAERAAIRRHYTDTLSWEQIGRLTVHNYRALVEARRAPLAR